MSTPIHVAVTIENGIATYKSTDSNQVQSDGTITIDLGEDAMITFAPDSETGQTWQFRTPGVAISPTDGDLSIHSQSATSVVLEDNNPKSTEPSNYEYTLYTTAGSLDPAIINKGN